MIPLGIVASARRGVSASPLTGQFLQAASDATDATTHTYADQNVGAADPTRVVVVALTARKAAPAATPAAVTIGGVAATVVTGAALNGNSVYVAYAPVPAGVTATVVVTWSATVLRGGIGLWRITGGALSASGNAGSGTTTTANASVIGSTGGFIVASSCAQVATTYEWTNAAERYDATVEGFFTFTGADSAASGAVTPSVTTATSGNPVIAAVAFAPA